MYSNHESQHIENKPNFIVRIFRLIWGFIKGYFMAIGAMVTLFPLLMIIMLSRGEPSTSIGNPVILEDTNVLKITLNGELVENRQDPSLRFFLRLFGDESKLYAPDFTRVLESAAKDDRIKAVYVEVESLSGSFAQINELRRGFKMVKEAGKPLYMQLNHIDNANYFISSLGQEISLTPSGSISVTGPVLSMVYFAEGLRKLGVEFEVFQAGKYKSAMENMIRNEPSKATREMYSSLEENLRNQMVQDIAAARGVEVGLARSWLSQSMFIPKDALEAGLITHLEYRDELEARIKATHNIKEFIKFSDYEKAMADLSKSEDIGSESEQIALIEAVGEIHMYSDVNSRDEVITPGSLIKRLEWAKNDENVKAVVLRISSPGGSATASDMIWRHVHELAQVKPVIASMMGYAASGGYYIAAGATKIISEPSTITGSIGVIGGLAKLHHFKEKYGVTFHTFTGSERDSLLNPSRTITDFDRALVDASITATYRDFLDRVAKGRNMSIEDVHKVAQGRVWTGHQAAELGLVDELGGYQESFQLAKELAGLDTKKKYRVATYKKDEMNLRDCLKSSRRLFECLREMDSTLKIAVRRVHAPQLPEFLEPLSSQKQWLPYITNKPQPLTLMPAYPLLVK